MLTGIVSLVILFVCKRNRLMTYLNIIVVKLLGLLIEIAIADLGS